MELEDVQRIASTVESLVTALGIGAAGIWAWMHFRRRREGYPHAAVSHETHSFELSDGRTLLRVAAKIANSGGVLLCLRYARTRVQHLFPLPEHIEALARDCVDPVPQGECELPWTVLGAREWRVDHGLGEVEPGESEVLHSDFIIPAGVEEILLYTYVSNHVKADGEVGWSDTAVVSLKKRSESHVRT